MDVNSAVEPDHARIVDYWNRRANGLSEPEWSDFYRLVMPVLLRTRLPARFSSDAQRRDLANLFFQDKILLNAASTRAGPLLHVRALHGYLKRYALDLLGEALQGEPLDPGLAAAPATTGHERLLREAGIDTGMAMHSADGFLARLAPGEIAYLSLHTCSDEQEREPVSAIARRFSLGTAFHHKARRLGITRSKGESYRDYGKTSIGRWMLDVGVEMDLDWREEIAALLTMLCQRVRTLYRGVA